MCEAILEFLKGPWGQFLLHPILFLALGAWLSEFLGKKMKEEISHLRRASEKFMHLMAGSQSQGLRLSIELRNEDLRMKYLAAEKGSTQRKYWHFRWRFEAFDELSLATEVENENGVIYIRVLGVIAQPILNPNETQFTDWYLVQVVKVQFDKKDIDLKEGDRACCFSFGENQYISKYFEESGDVTRKYAFDILGLGLPKTVWVPPEKLAGEIEIKPRAKDLPNRLLTEFEESVRKDFFPDP